MSSVSPSRCLHPPDLPARRQAFLCVAFGLVAAAAACVTGCGADPSDATSHVPPQGSAAPRRADWPMHRGGPTLAGTSSASFAVAPQIRWTSTVDGPIKAPAAIVGDRVFFGADDGLVRAIHLDSGSNLWTFATEGPIEAAPLVVRDIVVIGSSDFHVYALDADTGSLKWKVSTGDRVLAGANVRTNASGTVQIFVPSYDSRLYALDLQTGSNLWSFATESYLNGTPALSGSQLVFGGCDGHLYLLDADSGTLIEQMPIEAYIASSVAVHQGRAIFGHYGNAALSVDLDSGAVLWTHRDKEFPFFASAAVTDHLATLGSRDKRLHALDPHTGTPLWFFETKGRVDSSPVVCQDTVIVASQDGRLYGLAPADGSLRWTVELGGKLTASPAVAGSVIVIGNEAGQLFALASEPQPPPPEPHP